MTVEIQHERSLREHNTLGLAVTAERFVQVRTEAELHAALKLAREQAWPVTVLGGGSNVVLGRRLPGLVIRIGLSGMGFSEEGVVDSAAGESWHGLVLRSLQAGFSGLENLALIPGSVGAAPIQNIGAYGVELQAVFRRLWAIDRQSLEQVQLTGPECEFAYRASVFKHRFRDRLVITRVELQLSRELVPNLSHDELRAEVAASGLPITTRLIADTVCRIRRRKLPDPAVTANVGSFFKNPVVSRARFELLRTQWPQMPHWDVDNGVKMPAAWLIDHSGERQARVGGARLSTQHALVMINQGNADADDVLALAARIRTAVEHRFNLSLEIEPIVY